MIPLYIHHHSNESEVIQMYTNYASLYPNNSKTYFIETNDVPQWSTRSPMPGNTQAPNLAAARDAGASQSRPSSSTTEIRSRGPWGGHPIPALRTGMEHQRRHCLELGTPWNALEALEPQNLQTAELCRGDRTPQQRRYQEFPGAPLTESSPGHADGGTHSHHVLKDRSVVPRWIQRSWARPSGSPGSPNPKGYLWTQPELRWAPDLRTNMN